MSLFPPSLLPISSVPHDPAMNTKKLEATAAGYVEELKIAPAAQEMHPAFNSAVAKLAVPAARREMLRVLFDAGGWDYHRYGNLEAEQGTFLPIRPLGLAKS